ncbi:MAG: isoprenylcysteine carboxylmethyltransferase family protein [Acidobacteria bacterium]|nr:isoprenylcysteine carboxylmethyltransferase family protein [Acidobacteriota bacterium]MBU4306456.1 isoprenylcysteine carboxylmethyltransferase family protein [Acidobacteriota bacterium]MBU4404167.1 isoprenylcysteine carboxylmethyltransferase family protein [Acidobacteriota bacterium]MCG2812459.1 isoprenylcysteine carboxylmethyltransferase family protein [Candidatus Aminicenantes bacterium]
MKIATDESAAGHEKTDLKRAIGAACFRFRAISVVPVILLIYFIFKPVDPGSFNPILNILGFLLALTGAATRIASVGYSKPFTSGRENYLKADNLNTRGVYSIVRNPLYIGNFLIYNGVLVAYSSPAALAFFNAFFIVNYYFIILSEENYLENQFGDDYREYRRAVPKVIPRLTLYQKNDRPFSLAKVAYKEMNTTCYWIFFYAVSLLVKQYKVNDGAIKNFWWHAIPVLALFALNLLLRATMRSKPA